jgi:RHS repeat-associated protein
VPTDWIGNTGFVGGTDDANTGFETLGARQYDASTGRFLSIDPVFEATDITQLGGYDYAGNNPISNADPSGQLGSASCAPGMVGGPGACTGYENPTAQFPSPPRGGNGGWSSETVTLPHGTTYHGNVDGHGGTAINHVIFTPPSDATTAWDLAVALDKYKGDHPSTISPELAAKCGCQIDQDDAQHTLWGINSAYNENYIKINATSGTWKYEETHIWLTSMNGLVGPDPMWNMMPIGFAGIPGVEIMPEVPFEEPLEAPAVKPEAPAAKVETPSNKVVYGNSTDSGVNLKRSATVSDDKWQFSTGHGYDRQHTGPGGVKNDVRTTGLTPDQIEQGIADDVYSYMKGGGTVPRPGTPGAPAYHEGNVDVGGYNIGYRVTNTPDGTYRVGTYWLNP